MKKLLPIIVALESLWMYTVMFDRGNGWYLSHVANSLNERPYVFRVLLPLLSRLLEALTSVEAVYCMGVLFVLSGVGFFYSTMYLHQSFRPGGDWVAFIAFQGLFTLTLVETKVYDYTTAAFVALALALLARGKHGVFLFVFPLATLNRETTFLLTILYAVLFWKKLSFSKYILSIGFQVVSYAVIKVGMQRLFAGNGGRDAYFTFSDVIHVYSEFWIALIVLLPILYLIAKSWKQAPYFVRLSFLIVLPIQVALHVLFGKAFEFRVFAESVPVLTLLLSLSSYAPSLSPSPLPHTRYSENPPTYLEGSGTSLSNEYL